jgi:hypothetical protein
MRDCLVLFIHLIVTLFRRAMPRGARCVVAESVLVKHQLLILNRGRKRAPNLRRPIALSPVCAPFSWARPAFFVLPSF